MSVLFARRGAFSAAAFLAAAGAASAEPIRQPLLPTALSKPVEDVPRTDPAVTPAGALVPVIPAPAATDAEPLGLPRPVEAAPTGAVPPTFLEVARPAHPAKSAEPAGPIPPTPPDFNLRPADPGLNVNSIGLGVPATPPAPGVTPMNFPSKTAVMSAAVGLALSAVPAAAQPTADDVKKITDDITALKKDVTDVREALYGVKDAPGSFNNSIFGRLNQLDDKVRKIEDKLDKLNDQLGVVISSSAASPLNKGAAGVPQPMSPATGATAIKGGTVRVVNEYAVEVSLILNGKAYRFNPGETRAVEVPAGDYTYELLQSGSPPITSKVKEGETVTLRVH